MKWSWSISQQITLAMVAVLMAAVLALVPTILIQMRQAITQAQHRELVGYQQSFSALVASSSDHAESLARLVAEMPPIRTAFATGARDQLTGWLSPAFQQLKKTASVGQFQFHLPPATSFLRLHKPEKFGDDLSGFRQTVVETNQQHHAVKGLERGVAGLGVRGVVPMRDPLSDQQIGSVEFGLRFDQTFVTAFHERFGVDVSVFVLQNDGSLKPLASSRQRALLTSDALSKAANGETVFQDVDTPEHPFGVMAMALNDYAGQPAAVVELAMDNRTYRQAYHDMRTSVLAIAGLILALGITLAVVIGRSLSKPVRAMTASMHALADGDVTIAVPDGGHTSELCEMADALGVFQAQALENKALHEHEKEAESQAKADHAALMGQLRDEFDQAISGIVGGLSGSASTLRSTAESMASTAEETSRQASAVHDGASSASQNVDTVASAAEELSTSVAVISKQVQQSTAMISQAVDQAAQTHTMVHSLSTSAQEIGQVINLITDIAEQTNLLALNATIEAARAGNSGKGFAVVASEVKKLAQQTEVATSRIANQVKAVQDHTEQAVRAIDTIGRTIESVETTVVTIAAAVEEQNTATGSIARNVHDVASATQDVSTNIAGVSSAAGKTGQASHRLLDTASVVAEQSTHLQKVVAQFLNRLNAA